MHTNSRDEALALPTDESVRLALRTQQIIALEAGVTDSVDPLGGSYYLESLTNEIEKRVLEYITRIDAMGGAVKAIESKFYQTELTDSAYKYQVAIEQRERIIVGVNEFQINEATEPELLRIDESVRLKQIDRLNKVRMKRNQSNVRASLDVLAAASRSNQNLLPAILACVESYATVGEISDALRKVWGEYE